MYRNVRKSAAIAMLGVAVMFGASGARAGASDYVFEPVNAEVKAGSGSELAVRLVNKTTGKPVARALIIKSRLDMSPENMEAMTANLGPATEIEPGVYQFKSDLAMAGHWALKLMAKVQGELETVTGTVNFAAKE